MSEVYPSDNELLNIQSDEFTGVEYIPAGTSPYYLQFRRLLYRLLLSSRRANELRLYDQGGLYAGVKPGAFWCEMQLMEYPGSQYNCLADDKENIFIYLDADGNLIFDEYEDFPDMNEAPHVRLAIVTTASGSIQSIEDCRGSHGFVVPAGSGGQRRIITAHTEDCLLEQWQSGSIHTNNGAADIVTISLPESPLAGTIFTFTVQSSYQLRISPAAESAIYDDTGQGIGKYKYTSAIGASLSLAADSNGDWVTIAKNGVWNEQV